MKTSFIILAMLLAVPAIRQEVKHAPTAAQCQADQALWLSKLEGVSTSSSMKDVTYLTLLDWETEMGDCAAVDPQNRNKYYNTSSETVANESMREHSFIMRHGLLVQFIAEDTAGKR